MHSLLTKYPIISDQITIAELNVVLEYAQKSLNINGDFVEFGCYAGTTSLFLSRLLQRGNKKLWVYDSFEGLPEKTSHDESPAGFAFKKGELQSSKKQFISNYKKSNLSLPIIKKAWFKELKAKDLPAEIAFAFLDGDYYESIYTSLKLTAPKIHKNGYILVHDYGRATLPGAKKAANQFLAEQKGYKIIKIAQHIAIITA
jgi:O-methyltransferase